MLDASFVFGLCFDRATRTTTARGFTTACGDPVGRYVAHPGAKNRRCSCGAPVSKVFVLVPFLVVVVVVLEGLYVVSLVRTMFLPPEELGAQPVGRTSTSDRVRVGWIQCLPKTGRLLQTGHTRTAV